MKTALSGRLLHLLLNFLVRNALPESRIEFHQFNLALYFLLILAAPTDMVRLSGTELDEAIL